MRAFACVHSQSGEGGLGDEQGGEGLMADLRKFGGYSDGGRGGQRWGSYVDSGNAAGGYQGQYQSGGYMGGYAGGSSAAAGSSSSVGSYNS